MSKLNHKVWGKVIHALQSSNVTPKQMLSIGGAPEGLTNDRISQYKNGAIFPDLDHLPWLSTAIGQRPSYLAELLGAVPDNSYDVGEHVEALKRFENLTRDIALMERQLQESADSNVAKIVLAALATGHWAVAVWPASEGPEDCRMHVSDRVDFRRTDGGEETPEALKKDLGSLLPSAGLLKTPPTPRWSESPTPGLSLSLQPKLDYRSPRVSYPHASLHSVAIVSHTVRSWASDVASILATLIGYGLESTRSLKVRIHGGQRHPTGATGKQVAKLRAEIHENFLHTPPRRYVWYHFGDGLEGGTILPHADTKNTWPRETLVVRLRESDEMITTISKNMRNPEKRSKELLTTREETDAVRSTYNEQLFQPHLFLELEVQVPPENLDDMEARNWKRSQALNNAAEIVEYALANRLLDPLRLKNVLEEAQDHGTPDEQKLISWAKKHGRLIYSD